MKWITGLCGAFCFWLSLPLPSFSQATLDDVVAELQSMGMQIASAGISAESIAGLAYSIDTYAQTINEYCSYIQTYTAQLEPIASELTDLANAFDAVAEDIAPFSSAVTQYPDYPEQPNWVQTTDYFNWKTYDSGNQAQRVNIINWPESLPVTFSGGSIPVQWASDSVMKVDLRDGDVTHDSAPDYDADGHDHEYAEQKPLMNEVNAALESAAHSHTNEVAKANAKITTIPTHNVFQTMLSWMENWSNFLTGFGNQPSYVYDFGTISWVGHADSPWAGTIEAPMAARMRVIFTIIWIMWLGSWVWERITAAVHA